MLLHYSIFFLAELSEADINITTPSNLGEDYFNNSIKEPYLKALIKNLNGRFNNKDEIASFCIFNPERLRKSGDAVKCGIQEMPVTINNNTQ